MAVPVRLAAPPRSAPSPLARMAADVRLGLFTRPRSVPSKYFYDGRGSALFEAITRLPEYYQTRTEEALLASLADDLIARTRPTELVELGSGAGRKVGLLLDAMRRAGRPTRLTLFDINGTVARQSAARLASHHPAVAVRVVAGDFTEDLLALGNGGGRLAILFGGTIGNFHPDEVAGFLRRLGARLAPGDHFLVGVDTVKDRARLEAAYNDAAGVTAEFNRNILRHVNRALGGDFDADAFEHVAFWDARHEWIEMRLRAARAMRVHVAAAHLDVSFRAGDEIRTEISCKYTRAAFERRLEASGFALDGWFTDREALFALALLRRTA